MVGFSVGSEDERASWALEKRSSWNEWKVGECKTETETEMFERATVDVKGKRSTYKA